MRYIEIPNPITLRNVVDTKNEPVVYGLQMLNEQNVFNKPVWREKGKFEMFVAIYDKFDATKYAPGAIVALTDEEFEVYGPLAIMKGQDLNPAMAYELLQVMRAVLNATSERPRPVLAPVPQLPVGSAETHVSAESVASSCPVVEA